MEIIKKQISLKLQDTLKTIFQENIDYYNMETQLINHKILYCNKWVNNKYDYLIPLLKSEDPHLMNTFENNTLIQINIINAPPDCTDQLFHIDYLGDSLSYFIPFVELTDLNGTEYLFFYNSDNYSNYSENLQYMSDKYFDRNEIIDYLSKINLIYMKDYCFKCANSTPFSLIYMNNLIYHRGQKNKTNVKRIMLNILFSINNKYDYPTDEIVPDSEIDEIDRSSTILEKRKQDMMR
jgi:hypothetical protein